MGKKLVQAAILTFLIQLLALMSSPTTLQANSASNLQLQQKQVAVFLQRLGLLSNRRFMKSSQFENRIN